LEFVKYVTRWDVDRIERFRKRFANGEHPMELKKELAFEVAAAYHGEEAARAAQQAFESLHQRHEVPAQMPELRLDGARDIVTGLVEAVEDLALHHGRALRRDVSQLHQVLDARPDERARPLVDVRADSSRLEDRKRLVDPETVRREPRRE